MSKVIADANRRLREAGVPGLVTVSSLVRHWINERLDIEATLVECRRDANGYPR